MRILKLVCASTILLGYALAQPQVVPNGVLNSASYIVGQAVAPGSAVSIFGSGLAANTLAADTIPLSAALGSTEVFFNGEQAPLYFVSGGQINAQLPWDLPTSGTVNVTVKNGSVTSAPVPVQMGAAAPGIYSVSYGTGYAIAVNNADGSIAAPVGAVPGLLTHPANVGDVMILYANGAGAVGLSATQGGPPSPPANGANSLDVTRYNITYPTLLIGGTPAQILFSGLSPQFVGLNQINFIVPAVPAGNSIPIQLVGGGITSTNQVVIAIQ
jgi:uncharacterized protein (TIGR03437 family)